MTSEMGTNFTYAAITMLVALIVFAIYKEISFFTREEHNFGNGSLLTAIERAPICNLLRFPSKLIHWRKSLIFAFLIAGFSVVVYNSCPRDTTARSIGAFLIMVIGTFSMLYYKENFYSFHLYRHFAERFETELESRDSRELRE
jgi:hypothetical protein